MKILHVSTADSWRGGEQQVAYLTVELQKKDIAQIICCPDSSPLSNNCKQHNLPVASFSSRGIVNIKLAQHIKHICERNSVTLIHTHDAHGHTAAVLSAIIFGNKIPIVVSRRVDVPVSKSPFSKIKYNHHAIKKIICVSEKIKEITSPSIKDKSKLCVVYSGIDPEKFKKETPSNKLHIELGLNESVPIVGNISALAPHKDYYTFIDTAEIVLKSRPDVRFVIIGDGPEKEQIHEYIEHKNLSTKIICTGFRNDISVIFPELTIFLMTSDTEGLGTSLLDAFAANVAVVSTAAGGIPEIVKHNQTGLLAPIRDVRKLSDYVIQLLEDDELRKRIAAHALEFVKTFSKENTALNTLHYYDEVMTQNRN